MSAPEINCQYVTVTTHNLHTTKHKARSVPSSSPMQPTSYCVLLRDAESLRGQRV